MPCSKNTLILGAAGSRKTTLIAERALTACPNRVLITTFTNENVDQIKCYLASKSGRIPENIDVIPWFTFLLRHGVRPYQNMLSTNRRVRSIETRDPPPSLRFVKRVDVDKYYFTTNNDIYVGRVADFVCNCDDRTGGFVVRRLGRIYSQLFIDEFQDFAGYDFDLVEKLCRSSIAVTLACDPRQGTFSTNHTLKNKKYEKAGIKTWLDELEGLVTVEERNECFRSNQSICDFADELYPGFPKTTSQNSVITGHDGIFEIDEDGIGHYVCTYAPKILRYNATAQTMGLPAMNIGLSKGRTYDRVLIFPTEPISKYLRTRNLADVGDKAKLYVAVTRAKYSVAFVIKRRKKENATKKKSRRAGGTA